MGDLVLSPVAQKRFNRVMASVINPIRNLQAARTRPNPVSFEDVRDQLSAVPGSALRLRTVLRPAGITALLLQYSYLQLLDLLTTGAFLLAGVKEANPIIIIAMESAANPLFGLAAVKALALVLGLYCWWSNRRRLLKMATAFYAVLVAYNLVCLILGLGGR